MGGAGSAVAEVLAEHRVTTQVLHLGLPDHFVDHGDQSQLLASIGLDAPGVEAAIRRRVG